MILLSKPPTPMFKIAGAHSSAIEQPNRFETQPTTPCRLYQCHLSKVIIIRRVEERD